MYSIVWTNPAEQAAELLHIPDDEFVVRINEALTRPPTGALLPLHMLARNAPNPPVIEALASKRGAFPMTVSTTRHYVQPRIALIGYCPKILYESDELK